MTQDPRTLVEGVLGGDRDALLEFEARFGGLIDYLARRLAGLLTHKVGVSGAERDLAADFRAFILGDVRRFAALGYGPSPSPLRRFDGDTFERLEAFVGTCCRNYYFTLVRQYSRAPQGTTVEPIDGPTEAGALEVAEPGDGADALLARRDCDDCIRRVLEGLGGNEAAYVAAVRELLDAGEKPSDAAVARRIGVNRSTVSRRGTGAKAGAGEAISEELRRRCPDCDQIPRGPAAIERGP